MPQARPPLAIIGVGCRFPGSHGHAELWETLVHGRGEVSDTPAYRARTRASADQPHTHRGAGWRGSIGEVDGFDWRAFQMSPRESKYVDPQQRLLLETSWEAFEDAGLPLDQVAGTRTAVFMGIMWPDYAKLLAENPAQLAGYATSGIGFALAANRISYVFDLRGPSVSLDVQCASSLIAVSLAASSIWSEEAEMALAGGVNLILTADSDMMMSRAGILSPSGRCKTFDADADGFVRSEGVGVIVLKPLDRALADGDRVLATIRGAACNHDGRRAPLTAPSHQSQVELVQRACANADISPSELDYVELHGTGTAKGDPIEARALGGALAVRAKDDPCLVGSIKTNIGHCESAAGIASVIKVALALHHGIIPATINHTEMHPAIDSGALGVELVTEARRWPARPRPRLAGVSGFSLGGGNAHVVLGQVSVSSPGASAVEAAPAAPLLLPVSARTAGSLRELALAYAEHLDGLGKDPGALRGVCAAAALRRKHHEHRLAVVAETVGAFVAELRRSANCPSDAPVALPQRIAAPRVALLLSTSLSAAARSVMQRRVAELGIEPVHTLIGNPDRIEYGQGCWDLLLELTPQSSMQELAACLYRAGSQVRWSALYGLRCPAVPLPTYRWTRERLWIDPAPSGDFEDFAPESQNARHSQPRDRRSGDVSCE
jgi:acyl transferase domain-containing protein